MKNFEKEMKKYTLEDGQFNGMTTKEILHFLDKEEIEYDYQPETEDEGAWIVIGDYWLEHYEINCYDGVCEDSYWDRDIED